MAALQYVDVPGYHALLLRPSLTEFELPGGLIELAHEWLAPTKAEWSGDTRSWRFPGTGRSGAGGASLRFGYLDAVRDVARYAGSSFSFLGFDELVRFEQSHYQRMFRVLRQPHDTGSAFQHATYARCPSSNRRAMSATLFPCIRAITAGSVSRRVKSCGRAGISAMVSSR